MANDQQLQRSRSHAVYSALKRAILEQALKPGVKLPEDAIGEQFGVSRTLVREALVRLSGEGLIDLRANKGASVAQPSLEEGRSIFAVRQALERLVMETLAGKITPATRRQLEEHVAAETRARGRDEPTSIRLAGEFHTLLAGMTGNPLLSRYVNEVVSRCSLILTMYGRPHSSDCAISEHAELLKCLVAGKTKAAVEMMAQHLEGITSRALLDPRPDRDMREVLSSYAQAEGLSG
jgi:DNA-binding GntR family transcriptional regulator